MYPWPRRERGLGSCLETGTWNLQGRKASDSKLLRLSLLCHSSWKSKIKVTAKCCHPLITLPTIRMFDNHQVMETGMLVYCWWQTLWNLAVSINILNVCLDDPALPLLVSTQGGIYEVAHCSIVPVEIGVIPMINKGENILWLLILHTWSHAKEWARSVSAEAERAPQALCLGGKQAAEMTPTECGHLC